MTRGYSTRDVAGLVGLPEREVRALARAGVLEPERGPRRQYLFSFRDLVLLRTARTLREAELPHARIVRSLERLKEQLPHGRSLSELRIGAAGDEVVVSDTGAAWNPESGQIQLEFETAELAARVKPLARRSARGAERTEDMDAADWFALGLEMEPVAPDEARRAYQRALELEPGHADALVNLGRLAHEQGATAEAATLYRRALASSPRHVTAWFNLGVALEDLGRDADAIAAYDHALEADPDAADAHYNLARLHERLGDRAAAIRHLHDYRTLTRGAS